jgi:hypothetical protein
MQQPEPVVIDVDSLPYDFKRILTRIYLKPMSVIVIKGVPKSGKTDFALFIAECLKAMGLIKNFASNAEVLNSPWMQKIDALNILKAWGFANHESKLYIYDELIESATNRRAMSEINVAWLQYLPQISKAHMHILAIVQEEEGGKKFYESVFLDPVYLRGVWIKVKRDVAKFKSRFYYIDGYEIHDLPRTNITFDKDTPAHFSMVRTSNSDFSLLPRTFQVAMLYQRDEVGYDEVKKATGLTENKQVQREVKKALRMFMSLLNSDKGEELKKKLCNTDSESP